MCRVYILQYLQIIVFIIFFQDKDEQAFKHFQQVLRLAPDHKKAMETYKKAKLLKQKKEEGE